MVSILKKIKKEIFVYKIKIFKIFILKGKKKKFF